MPIPSSGRREPAALVSTTTSHPLSTAVRTMWTTVAGGWPSYRWDLPAITSTSWWPASVVTSIDRTTPSCPTTVGAGTPGNSCAGSCDRTTPRRSVVEAQPEPSTIATRWVPKRSRSAAAAVEASS